VPSTPRAARYNGAAEKGQFEIRPVSGEALEQLVTDVLKTPPELAEKAGALMK